MNFAFVLVSFGKNEPAGMERSVAALVAGLKKNGHDALIISAGPYRIGDPDYVVRLSSLNLSLPATDEELLQAISNSPGLAGEVSGLLAKHSVDTVIWVDALWGLGAFCQATKGVKSILMIHVLGSRSFLDQALLLSPDIVLVPSEFVRFSAASNGYDITNWRVLPNALLVVPPPPEMHERVELFRNGPIRSVIRLGTEKGPLQAIQSYSIERTYEIVLARAGFEPRKGSQEKLFQECKSSSNSNTRILPALRWQEVPIFLKHAALTVVPSFAETFGLVALESLSVGTPVVAFQVGNLPKLIGGAGSFAPVEEGPEALWRIANQVLTNENEYIFQSEEAVKIASSYSCQNVAKLLTNMA